MLLGDGPEGIPLQIDVIGDFPELGDRCQLVRATAVMAQTGTDDMPKTVVYVARDITEKAPEQVRKL